MKTSIYEIIETLGAVDGEAYFRIRDTAAPESVYDLAVADTHPAFPDLKLGWNGFMKFFKRKRPKGHAGADHLKLAYATSERWSDLPHYDGPDIIAGTPHVVEDYEGRPYSVLIFKEDVSAERMNEIAAALPVEKSISEGATSIDYSYDDLLRELHARGIVEAWTPFTYNNPSWDTPAARMAVVTSAARTDTPFLD